uniref:Uncharacterized protein n=1 Tax=viral metagenome TaxID=1070528 RepID=A0A6M3L892_9ZZZZ
MTTTTTQRCELKLLLHPHPTTGDIGEIEVFADKAVWDKISVLPTIIVLRETKPYRISLDPRFDADEVLEGISACAANVELVWERTSCA